NDNNKVSTAGKNSSNGRTPGLSGSTGGATTGSGETVPGATTGAAPGTAGTTGGGSTTGGTSGGGSTTGSAAAGATGGSSGGVSTAGATRVGVFPDRIEWGLHAPKTFNGAPLPLADDPLEGVDIYLAAVNNAGGVNGRKIHENFADDRYTVDGAKAAADTLINDKKVFFISGTLGVDQVAVVAAAARAAKPAPV